MADGSGVRRPKSANVPIAGSSRAHRRVSVDWVAEIRAEQPELERSRSRASVHSSARVNDSSSSSRKQQEPQTPDQSSSIFPRIEAASADLGHQLRWQNLVVGISRMMPMNCRCRGHIRLLVSLPNAKERETELGPRLVDTTLGKIEHSHHLRHIILDDIHLSCPPLNSSRRCPSILV